MIVFISNSKDRIQQSFVNVFFTDYHHFYYILTGIFTYAWALLGVGVMWLLSQYPAFLNAVPSYQFPLIAFMVAFLYLFGWYVFFMVLLILWDTNLYRRNRDVYNPFVDGFIPRMVIAILWFMFDTWYSFSDYLHFLLAI